MAGIDVEVGSGLESAGADLVAAWRAAEAGPAVEASRRIHFRDWAALCAVMTPERYEFIRHLKRQPGADAQAAAGALGRDADRVREDVEALAEIGLIVRAEDGGLTAPLDQIVSTIRFAA